MLVRRGFTLVELLMTLVVMGVLVAALIPLLDADTPDKLNAAADIVAADLENARALAVANGSTYRVTFNVAGGKYFLEHTGASTALDTLPPSAFRRYDDPATRQTTVLAELPLAAPPVRIATVVAAPSATAVSDVEFGPLGNTIRPQETVIWLSCGVGSSARHISIHVNPATGLVEVNLPLARLPTGTGLLVN
jgi:prepilin-type N-terminal cleavage/methylation domain-containing protein